jgi:hypothetical protein
MWPDWRDEGKPIEMVCGEDENGVRKGETVQGTLIIVEMGFDGEDEFPIWAVELDDRRTLGFEIALSWRFLGGGMNQ